MKASSLKATSLIASGEYRGDGGTPGQSVGDALDGHARNSPQMAHSSARTPLQFETSKEGPKEKSVTAITSDAVSRKVLSSCRLV